MQRVCVRINVEPNHDKRGLPSRAEGHETFGPALPNSDSSPWVWGARVGT